MFSSFFRLKENPFGETPNARFFFRSENHLKALERIVQALKGGKGFFMLTGEVGTGKTILSRTLHHVLTPELNVGIILQPVLTGDGLIEWIADELGAPVVEEKEDSKVQLDRLNEWLIKKADEGKQSIIIIDEAQRLGLDSLELVRLLSNLETEDKKLLQIVLVGQPELKNKLNQYQLRQLRQRLSGVAELLPLSLDETHCYIKHRLDVSGGSNFISFDEKAIRWVYQQTNGVPRLVNFCGEIVLQEAERFQCRRIDWKFIKDRILKNENANQILYVNQWV